MVDLLQTMRLRYGETDIGTPLTRLQLKMNRNRSRRDAIRREVESLLEEERRLGVEHERMEMLREGLVEELADDIRRRHGEVWSPVPMIGFRLWAFEGDQVVGATGHAWDSISQDARCARSRRTDDLPHTDHMCSSVGHGCGIYAATEPGELPWPGSDGYVAGVVLLSGKVVEHEQGFRAGHAQVAGVVAHHSGRVLVTTRGGELRDLFASPRATLTRIGTVRTPPGPDELAEELERMGKEIRSWT